MFTFIMVHITLLPFIWFRRGNHSVFEPIEDQVPADIVYSYLVDRKWCEITWCNNVVRNKMTIVSYDLVTKK